MALMKKRGRPRKVKPEVIEGEFKVVQEKAHVAPIPALPPAPPKPPSDLMKRMDAAAARARAKRPDLTNYVKATPPIPTEEVTGETVLAGKSIAAWHDIIEQRCENGGIIDLTDLPAWVSWGVDVWKRKGRPTAASRVYDQITALRSEAEKLSNFANLDQNKAIEEKKAGNHKKYEKLMEQAEKKREKAEEKRQEASKLVKEWEAKKS